MGAVIRPWGVPSPTQPLGRWARYRGVLSGKFINSDPPEVWAVFSEASLLALSVDHPDALERQVEYLLEAAQAATTTIQMTPAYRLGPGLGGPFAIMDFPDSVDASTVFLETDTDGLYLEEPGEVARYRNFFGPSRTAALTPVETVERVTELIT